MKVVVIGGGPGGYVAAIRAAQLGHDVVIVEKADLGGVCLNWGCIPTKTLLRSAEIYQLFQHSGTMGIHAGGVEIKYPEVIGNSRDVAGKLSQGIGSLMKKNKITTVYGHGKLVSPDQVEVTDGDGNTQKIDADRIIISTGARPREIPSIAADGNNIWNSRHALAATEQPKSIAIVGAGAIGVEFAYFFQSIGTDVTIIEMLPRLVPQEDEDISRELARSFKKQGMSIYTESRIESIEEGDNGLILKVDRKGESLTLEAEKALLAIGVQGNIENLGLEEVGIKTEKGWIQTDEYYQTNIESVYAIGDIIGPPWLAHVASHEGLIAVEHMSGEEVEPLEYNNVPGCTYCKPQIASVGLTEGQAKEEGYDVQVGKFPFQASGKALAMGEPEGFVKMIIDGKYGEILGCHIIGSEATELIAELALGKTQESTYMEILHTVHPHPTLSEAVLEATLGSQGRALHI